MEKIEKFLARFTGVGRGPKWVWRRYRRSRSFQWRVARWLSVFLVIVGVFSYATNPFVRFTLVADDYVMVDVGEDGFVIDESGEVFVREDAFFRRLAFLKSGWHILANKVGVGRRLPDRSVDEIVRQIHEVRFDPEQPYLISGDHFSVFYPRSLGVFYHSLPDPRTALDADDWQNRQHIYLKSLVFALQAYGQSETLSTTLVPVGPRSVAQVNFYAYPSDTLYSLLYGLEVLGSDSELRKLYPFGEATEGARLVTKNAAEELVGKYGESLERHVETYRAEVIDPETGLVRRDKLLSSTKDVVKRASAFYDNVVAWRTFELAERLGLVVWEEEFLDNMREKIIEEYWLADGGYFLDQMSPEAIAGKYYSADWLMAYMTGMLDPENPDDREKLVRSVSYIQRNAMDQPFGLQYQTEARREEMYLIPGLFAPRYASTAIWSNWGMEYVKLLVSLAQVTGDRIYMEEADRQLSAYAFNIKRYKGYPEVYNAEGDFFRSRLYKSVRQTGWVVSYEQARTMYEWTRENWDRFD